MMQVSTLYAHSLERQLVSRRNQLIQNLSRSVSLDQAKISAAEASARAAPFSDADLFEAGLIPLLPDDVECGIKILNGSESKEAHEIDPKELTDRLCRLPTKYKSDHYLGPPRRHSIGSTPRLYQASLVSVQSLLNLQVPKNGTNARGTLAGMETKSKKNKKHNKKIPSNFMHLGVWTTRQHCEKLIQQVKTGDVLEFNITLHHHWGIALIPKNKKPSLETIEMVHLYRNKNGLQKPIKESLSQYWTQGVTARINNSNDVNKPPHTSEEVASIALKVLSQPQRLWENTVELINFCRYGEHNKSRKSNDDYRCGALSRFIDLFLSFASKHNTPVCTPKARRKRTESVNF